MSRVTNIRDLIHKYPNLNFHIGDTVESKTVQLGVKGKIVKITRGSAYVKWPSGIIQLEFLSDLEKEHGDSNE